MKFIIFGWLLFLSSISYADPWSSSTKILQLYPAADGLIFITDSYSNTELSSCDGGKRFYISKNHANYQVMVSVLIAAFMADKEVSLNIDGEGLTSPVCYPSINRFFVFK